MAEELNTSMHEEFIAKEIPNLDLRVMATYGAMRRGLSKKEALAQYELTEKEYDTNINRVLLYKPK